MPWQNNFHEELLKKYSKEEINLTGLYYKNDKTGKYIDRFNSRVIFPVNNLTGDTIALGGRIIRESKLAKYINSPETEFYKKGRHIFNLDKAKEQFKQVPMMIEAFEHWFGPYPFYEDSFKMVEVPYLGMEHQSSITYGNKYQNGYLGRDLSGSGWGLKFDYIIIHEGGHEWFANNITYKAVSYTHLTLPTNREV